MSENKRYSFKYYNDVYMIRIIDNYKEEPNGWGVCNVKETVQRLNELNEGKEILEEQLESATNEIKKLMAEINMLTDTCHDCCKEIREENKELKHRINDFKHEIHRLKHELKQKVIDTDMMLNNQLKEENKELKEELNFYKNQCIDEDIKYLRENTVWEQMPTKTRTYTKTNIRDDLND